MSAAGQLDLFRQPVEPDPEPEPQPDTTPRKTQISELPGTRFEDIFASPEAA